MVKWFVIHDEKVTGPFVEDEIKAQLAEGRLSDSDSIWGRPVEQWTKISKWRGELAQMTASVENLNTQQMWHYAVEGDSKGPMTRTELVNELKAIRNKTDILVWTKGMKAWADLYDFHDILDEVGLNRREHARCQISGSVVIKFEDQTLIGQLRSISIGGIGCSNLNVILPIGQQVQIEIKSDSLGETILARGTVQYISEGSYVGCKFTAINMDAKSRIMGYVRNVKSGDSQAA